ncbi:eukaryotic aspartyl protease [Ostertagia ostertagi]
MNDLSSETGGELTLCGLDSSHYQEPLVWIPLALPGTWKIALDSVTIQNVVIEGPLIAIVDTGTSMIAGPTYAVQKIQQAIGASPDANGDMVVDCSTIPQLPIITFIIGDMELRLGGSAYIVKVSPTLCWSGFQSMDLPTYNGYLWILGDAFIRNFYTVFDHGNRRIGFAVSV